MGTDSYPKTTLHDGAVIGCESKKIVVGVDEDAIAKATGANDSKEEGAEKMDSDKQTVINIVNAHDLQSTTRAHAAHAARAHARAHARAQTR